MEDNKATLYKALTGLVLVGAVLMGTKILTEAKEYRFIGAEVIASNTISVYGSGEIYQAPDIARVSFTVREESEKVVEAQNKLNTKIKASLDAVRKLGIEEDYIKTENYNSSPKYEWQNQYPCNHNYGCDDGKSVIIGYEFSQSVTLTIHNLEIIDEILGALGQAEVSDIQGPNFAIENEDDLKAEARKDAIDEARTKAEALARDLGVTLGRITWFSEEEEGSSRYKQTIAYFQEGDYYDESEFGSELPQGETKITSNVTLTYEIR